jgi:hypothetical protein
VIETFELDGHATASRCYAFHFVQNDKPEIKTVLGVAGINSPHKAPQGCARRFREILNAGKLPPPNRLLYLFVFCALFQL